MSGLIWSLDLGSRTGWAYGTSHRDITSGAQVFKDRSMSEWAACTRAARWLNAAWHRHPPSMLVIEALLPLQAHRDRNNSEAAVNLPRYLIGVAAGIAGLWNAGVVTVARSTTLKHFIGNGRPGDRKLGKGYVIERCRLLHYVPVDCLDDDRCDAIAMLDWALAALKREPVQKLHLFGEAAE